MNIAIQFDFGGASLMYSENFKLGCHPESAVGRGRQRHDLPAKFFVLRVGSKVSAAQKSQAVPCPDPNFPMTILGQGGDVVFGRT